MKLQAVMFWSVAIMLIMFVIYMNYLEKNIDSIAYLILGASFSLAIVNTDFQQNKEVTNGKKNESKFE